jgi:hypothetical protein
VLHQFLCKLFFELSYFFLTYYACGDSGVIRNLGGSIPWLLAGGFMNKYCFRLYTHESKPGIIYFFLKNYAESTFQRCSSLKCQGAGAFFLTLYEFVLFEFQLKMLLVSKKAGAGSETEIENKRS